MEAKTVEIEIEDLREIIGKLSALRDEMDSIMEELEILIDKELMHSIDRGIEEIKKGNLYTLEDFKKSVNG